MSFSLGLIGIALLLVSCSDPSPMLDPNDPLKKVDEDHRGIQMSFRPKLDVLFVIDDSGSMGGHQKNLSSQIHRFTDSFLSNKAIDYHVGVITTDMKSTNKSGRLVGFPRFIDRETPDRLLRLRKNMLVGTSGSIDEETFRPIMHALSDPIRSDHNGDFYREEALLVLVLITDAVDQGPFTGKETYQFLLDLKDDPTQIVAYGVIVPSGVSYRECPRDVSNNKPVKIEEFIFRSGGLTFSLCDSDYGDRLAQVGRDLEKRIGMFVPVNQRPDVSTIEVWLGEHALPNHPDKGWTYNPQRVGIQLGRQIEVIDTGEIADLKITFIPAKIDESK